MGLFDRACRRLIHPLWARHEDPRAAVLQRELSRRQFDAPAVIRAWHAGQASTVWVTD